MTEIKTDKNLENIPRRLPQSLSLEERASFLLPIFTASRVNSKYTLIPASLGLCVSEITRWDFPATHQHNREGLLLIFLSYHSSQRTSFLTSPPLLHTSALWKTSLSFTGNNFHPSRYCHRGEKTGNFKAEQITPRLT